MLPPIVLDSIVLRWNCHHSTHCCRSWRVDVPPATLLQMAERCTSRRDTETALRLVKEHNVERRLDGSCALPMTPDGACMFLRDDNLCRYRIAHGDETLPISCTKFPLLGILTPKRRLYGLSFSCPTALTLLATSPQLELVEAYAGPPPSEVLCDISGDDGESGPHPLAITFWDAHWDWLSLLRRTSGCAPARLRVLAESMAGCALPTVSLEPAFWTARQFDPQAGAPLLRQGAVRSILEAVYDDHSARSEPTDIPADPDEQLLLNRYLDHRLLAPEFIMTGASLARLLGVLFVIVARYRLERARGTRPLHAIMHLDRLLLHADYLDQLFPEDVPETEAWQTLAMMALAQDARPGQR